MLSGAPAMRWLHRNGGGFWVLLVVGWMADIPLIFLILKGDVRRG